MLLSCIYRVFHLLSVLSRHVLAHCAGGMIRRHGWLARRLPPTGLTRPERLRAAFEDMGGSFIKLGQMLALQPDILPIEYCNALYDLLDHVSPLPADAIESVFRAEIGAAPGAIFDHFEAAPLASGSIGQVHRAWLEGQKVAVKIQRPDTRTSFDRDVKLMRLVSWCVRAFRIRPLEFLVDPLTEFAAWTQDELDFRREAAYMRLLRRSIDDDSQYIPSVVAEYSTHRVLVVEFLEGITLMDHLRALDRRDPAHEERLRAMGYRPERLARNIIENCLGNVFSLGIFHADLHPANLMILPGNVVGYIDFGITGVISRYSRQNLLAMTLAYARKDVDSLCSRFFAVSSLDESSDPHAFREGVKRLSEHWYTPDPEDPRLKITTTQVMLDMLKLSREARIWPQRDIIKYIRSAIAIDGLIHRFAPDFDFAHHLGAACRRHLTSHARRLLVSHDMLFNFSNAGVDLVRDGMFRFAAALENLADAPLARRGAAASPTRWPRARWVVQGQLLLMLVAALLAALRSHETLKIGFNVLTAELVVAAAATRLLVSPRGAALLATTPRPPGR